MGCGASRTQGAGVSSPTAGRLHDGNAVTGPVAVAGPGAASIPPPGQPSQSVIQSKGRADGGSVTCIATSPAPAPAAAGGPADSAASAAAAQPAEEPALSIVLDDDPLAVTRMGVSLRGLRRLRARLADFFGGEAAYAALSTEEVNTRWVQVATRGSRCRVAEDPSLLAPEDVGAPHYFISHAWKNRFELLLASVESFLSSADDETRVWIDILAVNQHPEMPHQARDVAAFKDVVRTASQGTLVVLDMAHINPATRAWCVYEWAACLAAHGPDGLHLRAGPADRAALAANLDVEAAQCYNPRDKDMILQDVVAQHGSTAAFNHKLRLQLLLEPLSYTVDVRRLLARSEGTAWRFDAVRQMIVPKPPATAAVSETGAVLSAAGCEGGGAAQSEAAGAGAMERADPRAMVVCGGAGEGKSTISAALVSGKGLEGLWPGGQGGGRGGGGGDGGGVGPPASTAVQGAVSGEGGAGVLVAYHFLKYSDQRRLDPRRIVKSLAYQLAMQTPVIRDEILAARPAAVISGHTNHLVYDLLACPLRELQEGEAHGIRSGGAAAQPAAATAAGDQGEAAAPPEPPKPPTILIIIDAIDEADPPPPPAAAAAGTAPGGGDGGGGGGGGEVASSSNALVPCGNKAFELIKELRSLPSIVRFLFTTRPDAVGGQVLPALRRAFGQDRVAVVRPGELRGAAGAVGSVCGGGGSRGTEDDAGVLVYHTVAAGCLPQLKQLKQEEGAAGADAAASVAAAAGVALPPESSRPSLKDLYRLYGTVFARAWVSYGSTEAAGVSALLEALLASQEPLPLSRLQALGLGRLPPRLPGWPLLFSVDEHHLYVLHKSLTDWITSYSTAPDAVQRTDGSNTVAVVAGLSTARGHLILARQLASERFQAAVKTRLAVTAGDDRIGSVGGGDGISPYCYKYVVRHLVQAIDRAAASGRLDEQQEAVGLLDEVLADFDFLAEVFKQGLGHAVIQDLAALQHPSAVAADTLRFLLLQQHELGEVKGTEQLLHAALACPSRTLIHRAATARLNAQQLAAGRLGVVQEQQEGGPPQRWSPLVATMKGYKYAFKGVAFSPDGRHLASCAEVKESNVRLWDAGSGAQLASTERAMYGRRDDLKDPVDLVSVTFTLDGTAVLAASAYGSLHVYDVATADELGTPQLGKVHVCRIVRLGGREVLLAGRGSEVVLWARKRSDGGQRGSQGGTAGALLAPPELGESWELLAVLQGHSEVVSGVELAEVAEAESGEGPTGEGAGVDVLIASCSTNENAVRLWRRRRRHGDLGSGSGGGSGGAGSGAELGSGGWTCMAEIKEGHTGGLECMALSPGGCTLATGGGYKDKCVRLWRPRRHHQEAGREGGEAWRCVAVLKGHLSAVGCLAFLLPQPGLLVLASGGSLDDNAVRLWVCKGVAAADAGGAAAAAAAGPDGGGGSGAAGTGTAAAVEASDPGNGGWVCAVQLQGHGRDVLCVAVNPVAPHALASSGKDGSLRLWDLRGEALEKLEAVAKGDAAATAEGEEEEELEDPSADRDPHSGMIVSVRFSHLPPPAASHKPQAGAHVGAGGGAGGDEGQGQEQERVPELLVATTIGGTVRVWERRLQGGRHSSTHEGPWACTGRLKVPDGHDTRMVAVAGPDASGHVWLAAAGFDRRLRLWRRGDGGRQGNGRSAWECMHTMKDAAADCLAFISMGPTRPVVLAVAGGDRVKLLASPQPPPATEAVSYKAGHAAGAVGEDNTWERVGEMQLSGMSGESLTSLTFARGGSLALVTDSEGGVWVLVQQQQEEEEAEGAGEAAGQAGGGGGGDGVAGKGGRAAGRHDWRLAWQGQVPQGSRAAAISPDGSTIAVGGRKSVHIFECVAVPPEYCRSEDSYDSSEDEGGGEPAGAAAAAPAREVWIPVGEPMFFPWDVGALAFSCDSRTLVVGGGAPRGDNALRAYRAVPGWEPPPSGPAAAGADSRDAEREYFTGRRVERVEMEGSGAWRLMAELRGHTSPTWALAFHPTDPLLLASGGSDQSVRLWRLVEGEEGQGQGARGRATRV